MSGREFKKAVLHSFQRKNFHRMKIKKKIFQNTALISAYHPRLKSTIRYRAQMIKVLGIPKLEVTQLDVGQVAWIDDVKIVAGRA